MRPIRAPSSAKSYSAKLSDGWNPSLGVVDVIQSVQHPDGVSQSAGPALALTRRIVHVY